MKLRRPLSGRATLALAGLLLGALPFALFVPALVSGRLPFGVDLFALLLPYRCDLMRCLAAHEAPLWLPNLFGGTPGLAASNMMFFYPIDLLGTLFKAPVPLQLGLDGAVSIALAGLGMHLLLRRLGRSPEAALLGAFCFAWSGSIASQFAGGFYCFVEGTPLIPWVFWAAHKGLTERSPFAWGLCGLGMALLILCESVQLLAYAFPALLLFLALLPRRGSFRLEAFPLWGGLGLALLLAFLVSAPQIWPLLQFFPLCSRPLAGHFERFGGSITLAETGTYWIPRLFGGPNKAYTGAKVYDYTTEFFGLLPWALAAAGLAVAWSRKGLARFWLLLVLAAFFFAQKDWTPYEPLLKVLPFFSGFGTWSRILFLVPLAVSALAAEGWDALRSPSDTLLALKGAFAFCCLAAALALGVLRGGAPAASGSAAQTLAYLLALPPLLVIAARWKPALGALALLLAFQAADLARVLPEYLFFVPPSAAAHSCPALPPPPGPAEEPWRIYDSDQFDPNKWMVPGQANAAGGESMHLLAYDKITEAMPDARRRLWADFFGVRYIITSENGRPRVFRSPNAFPRIWAVESARVVPSDDQAYVDMANPAFDPRRRVDLSAPAGILPADGAPELHIRWLGRTPLTSTLWAESDRDAVLVRAESWYPSWRAEIDGKPVPLLKADGIFQAIPFPKGTHRVVFRFDTGLFDAALAACALGLLALVGLWICDHR
jgi:hypothetical protein